MISYNYRRDDLLLETNHHKVHPRLNSLAPVVELPVSTRSAHLSRLVPLPAANTWKVLTLLRLGIAAIAFCIIPLDLVHAQNIKAIELRLGEAVEAGELTLKQASIMLDALKRSSGSEHGHHQAMAAKKRRHMGFASEIKAAVDAGEISKEDAEKTLIQICLEIFRDGD